MNKINKKFKLITLLLFSTILLYSQKQGNIRVGGNIDLAFPNQGFGFGGDIDGRYNILDNLNAGIKVGTVLGFRDKVITKSDLTGTLKLIMINSYLLTSDYYLNYGESVFAPYVGGGFGLFNITNVKFAVDNNPNYSSLFNIARDNKIGGLLRAGVEISKFRLGAEYYFIPRSDLYDITHTKVGVTSNSYFNISIGFYIGGGKWDKNNFNY